MLSPGCDNEEGKISSPFGPKKVEKVKITFDHKINTEIEIPEGLTGSVSTDADPSATDFETPVHPVGRVMSLEICEMPIELKNTELKDGILSTREYGDIEVLLVGFRRDEAVFELRSTRPQLVNLTKKIIEYQDSKRDVFSAVLDDDIPKLKALIDAKVDLNVRSIDDVTPLIAATVLDSQKVVQLLLDANANVNAKDSSGWTALIHSANTNGNPEIASALIKAHADINASGKYGTTALFMAAVKGNIDLVKALVEAGADLNAAVKTTGDSLTALHAAERQGNKEIAEFLKKAGAN